MNDRSIEVNATDVDKAVEQGLMRLGLTRDQVQIEVVDQGSRGILGIGARDAVVRLSPHPPEEELVLPIAEPAHEIGELESAAAEALDQDAEDAIEPELSEESDRLSQEQVARVARETLCELLEKMGIDCTVQIRHVDSTDAGHAPITLDVLGEDLDLLIGRHGEVLNALQYISRLIVSREVEHWVNLVVDVERYKQRRAKSLRQLAERIAERVARTRQPVALEPMPPNERRVIHVALHDHPTVTTQSVGKGDQRKVTIIPRRK